MGLGSRSQKARGGSREDAGPEAAVYFDVWGCRGSRNLVPDRSRIGNRTSCYSVVDGSLLLVLDAGRGLAALGFALGREPRLSQVRHVHILVSHAHLDHWEGLKDVDWFWERGNGLHVTLYANAEAMSAIRSGFTHPAYVPLERLAEGTLARFTLRQIQPGERWTAGLWRLRAFELNHYSGRADTRAPLDTVGFHLSRPGGPRVSYLSDHEPTAATAPGERRAARGAGLIVYDCHYASRSQHAFGHGSQEHAAEVARRTPGALVLAGHLGPSLSDASIRAAYRLHGAGLPNFQLAVEGASWAWDAARGRFVPRRSLDVG